VPIFVVWNLPVGSHRYFHELSITYLKAIQASVLALQFLPLSPTSYTFPATLKVRC